jgi:hypothetical protein
MQKLLDQDNTITTRSETIPLSIRIIVLELLTDSNTYLFYELGSSHTGFFFPNSSHTSWTMYFGMQVMEMRAIQLGK